MWVWTKRCWFFTSSAPTWCFASHLLTQLSPKRCLLWRVKSFSSWLLFIAPYPTSPAFKAQSDMCLASFLHACAGLDQLAPSFCMSLSPAMGNPWCDYWQGNNIIFLTCFMNGFHKCNNIWWAQVGGAEMDTVCVQQGSFGLRSLPKGKEIFVPLPQTMSVPGHWVFSDLSTWTSEDGLCLGRRSGFWRYSCWGICPLSRGHPPSSPTISSTFHPIPPCSMYSVIHMAKPCGNLIVCNHYVVSWSSATTSFS